jgi:hypothetical protein
MANHPTADLTPAEATLREDLQRWAEAGAPSFDLNAGLARRTARRRSRWIRWSSVAAATILLSTSAVVTFPAWAASAANWPIIGEPIKAYLAERAGLSWAYKMGFMQGALAELSDGTVTLRVLGVLVDPIETRVFYQISGLDPNPNPAQAGDESYQGPNAELSIRGIDGVGRGVVSANHPISDWYKATEQYYVAETTPIPGDQAVLTLELRVGDQKKQVVLPVSRAESSKYFKELAVSGKQVHGPVAITLEHLVLSPAEVVLAYQAEVPPTADAMTFRGPLLQPFLRVGGKEYTGQSLMSFSINHHEILSFPRVSGKAQLVIPSMTASSRVDARWAWAPGTVTDVGGVPVKLEQIRPGYRGGLDVEWTYPADAKLLGLGDITIIGTDGSRHPVENPGVGSGTANAIAHANVLLELPPGVEPAAIEVGYASWRVDGPWVFDLPELPKNP